MSKKRQTGCNFIASKHATASGASDLFIFLMECEAINPSCWQAGRQAGCAFLEVHLATAKSGIRKLTEPTLPPPPSAHN